MTASPPRYPSRAELTANVLSVLAELPAAPDSVVSKGDTAARSAEAA